MSGNELWFGTPIYSNFSNLDNQNSIQKEIQIAYDDLLKNNKLQNNPEWNSHLISDLNFKDNIIEKYNMTVLSKCIKDHVLSYLQESQSPVAKAELNYKITASWITVTKKNMYARSHTHGDADISGCYYFKTNTQDGSIFFNNPNQLIMNSMCFGHMDQTIYFKPSLGRFLLFPGWLQHGVQTNTTDDDRISLSFNIQFRR